MILVYIENKEILTKTISYLENANINYVTDIDLEYEYILLAEVNNKILKLIENKKNKKIIFITYLEEENILNNKISEKLKKLLNKSYKIIVSLPSIKKNLKKVTKNEIVIIEHELPIISISKSNSDIYNKYKISRRKKKIVLFDFDYNNIEIIYELAHQYKKINFVYVGFKPDYLLKEKQKDLLNNMPKNITYIKYYNFNILCDISKISYLIISFNTIDINYLYMILLFKKQLLIKENNKYEDYLINSKNSYIFKDNKDLLIRLNKILDNRVSNLTDNGYLLIKNNTFNEITKKYSFYIR